MDCVVSLEDGRSKHVVGLVNTHQQEHAYATILVFACIQHVFVLRYLDPLLLKHKVEVWEVAVALSEDETLVELIIVVADISEDFLNEIIKVEGRDQNAGETCIEE